MKNKKPLVGITCEYLLSVQPWVGSKKTVVSLCTFLGFWANLMVVCIASCAQPSHTESFHTEAPSLPSKVLLGKKVLRNSGMDLSTSTTFTLVLCLQAFRSGDSERLRDLGPPWRGARRQLTSLLFLLPTRSTLMAIQLWCPCLSLLASVFNFTTPKGNNPKSQACAVLKAHECLIRANRGFGLYIQQISCLLCSESRTKRRK